jgi:hypothetical protein
MAMVFGANAACCGVVLVLRRRTRVGRLCREDAET